MKTMTLTLLRATPLLAVLAWPMPAAAQSAVPVTPAAQTPNERPRAVRTEPATRAQTPRPAALPSSTSDRSAPQAFSVVLVLGDMQTSTTADSVPAAARKALTDMKDFLPYKGYRLLDTQWTLCCGSAPLSGRLKGPDEQEYELTLQTNNIRNGEISVRFLLREAASGGASEAAANEALMAAEINERSRGLERRLSQLQQQRAELARRIREAPPAERAGPQKEMLPLQEQIARMQDEIRQSQLTSNHPEVRVGAGFSAVSRSALRSASVIDASFRMEVGETVVVGTSRTKGDKALIALLTAVPQKSTGAR